MTARLKASRFAILVREFFAQFFVSESATSDHQLRTAVIGVIAFLITRGFSFPSNSADRSNSLPPGFRRFSSRSSGCWRRSSSSTASCRWA